MYCFGTEKLQEGTDVNGIEQNRLYYSEVIKEK